jgi:nitroreductase
MTAWDAIRTKRAVRSFEARPLPEEHLARILDAGRHAGSSKNQQRWDFVVVRDRALLGELAKVGRYAGHLAGAAVAVALVTPEPATPEATHSIMWDLGQAAQNMMLAAWELEIGSCPATVYDQPLVQRLLGLPADRRCQFLLSFGYPANPAMLEAPPRPGGRKPLGAVVHEERW